MFLAEGDEQGGLSYEVCVQEWVLKRKSQDILWNTRHNEHIIYYLHLKPEAGLCGSDRLHSVVEEVVEDGNIIKDIRMSQ